MDLEAFGEGIFLWIKDADRLMSGGGVGPSDLALATPPTL